MAGAPRFAILLAAVFLFSSAAAQAPRAYRVAILNPGFSAPGVFSPLGTSLVERLATLGFREGENLVLERRWAEGRLERLAPMTEEMLRAKVDVIVTIGNKIQPIVQKASAGVPMVSLSCDPFAAVASYARPDGNFTGVTCMSTELSPKRLELAKQLVPGATRVVYLHNPGQGEVGLKLTQEAATRLGLSLSAVEARSGEQLAKAFDAIAADRPDVLLVYPDNLTMVNREAIVRFAAARRLPAVYAYREFAEAGGLLSYGSTLEELGERAAELTVKILRGAKPGELPLEQATRVYLTVNLKAAQAIGFKVPPAILQRADRILQ